MKIHAAFLILALAACSPGGEEEETQAPAATGSTAPAAPRAALTAEDIEGAQLAGELTCAFSERGMRAPLLAASADVDDAAHAEGVLKLGPSAVRLESDAAGGFNALVNGARFTSGDLTANVVVTSSEPLGEGESPPLAAVLELGSEALGAQRIEGEWTCGP
jgi:hypothetical protein